MTASVIAAARWTLFPCLSTLGQMRAVLSLRTDVEHLLPPPAPAPRNYHRGRLLPGTIPSLAYRPKLTFLITLTLNPNHNPNHNPKL